MRIFKYAFLLIVLQCVIVVGLLTSVNAQPQVDWKQANYSNFDEKNKSYERTRKNVELLLQRGKSVVTLESTYRSYAAKRPLDLLAQYRWLFTAYRLKNKPIDLNGLERLAGIMDSMPSPNVREWTRLRFLISVLIEDKSTQLIPVGDRLLKLHSQDFDVKYAMVRALANSSQIDDKRRAVIAGENLVRSNPNRASFYAMLGYAYKILWLNVQKKIYSDKAISAYTKFLKVAAPRDPYRKGAQYEIQWLKDHTDENGKYKSHRPYDP